MKIISLLLLSSLIACSGDKGEDEDQANPAGDTEPAAMVADDAAEPDPATAGEPAADELPTAADFENEANQAITDENLEKQLEELEQEIGD
jgi:hypothetical protein